MWQMIIGFSYRKFIFEINHNYLPHCPVLNRLCEYGYIAPKPTEPALGVGRRPSEVYLTNPVLLAS